MLSTRPIYSPLYGVPSGDSPVIFDYSMMQKGASVLSFLVPVKVALPAALSLAEQAPYPRAVKLGIMKQVANYQYVTLSQLRIFLGWASDRAQR